MNEPCLDDIAFVIAFPCAATSAALGLCDPSRPLFDHPPGIGLPADGPAMIRACLPLALRGVAREDHPPRGWNGGRPPVAATCRNERQSLTFLQTMSNGIFNELEFELQPVQSDDEAFGARLIAGHVIGDFPLLHAYFGNERTYGRLVGLVQAHMRRAGGGIPRDFALSRQPATMLGFEFRGESHLRLKALRRRLRIVPCLERRKLEVTCKPFAPHEVLAFPAGATHVSFVWVFGQLPDFTWSAKKRGYRPVNRDHARERFLPMPPQPADCLFNPEGILRLDLPTELPNPPRTSLLVGLGVVFFRQVDTQLVAMHTYNNCVVVKVVV